jgi:hypothetical protein
MSIYDKNSLPQGVAPRDFCSASIVREAVDHKLRVEDVHVDHVIQMLRVLLDQ